MRRAIFQSYTLVKNSGYKDAFEWSVRSWSDWCKRWGVAHYLRSEIYNYGDTQFLNQMQYEPVCDVEYDLGALVDCFTLIHPLLHPSKVFSNSGYLNLTELGNQFISIIAGDSNYLSSIEYVPRAKYGERTLLERDSAILEVNRISDVVCNSVDLATVEGRYKIQAIKALTFQPSIVRFSNETYNKFPNIYWSHTCTFMDKNLY
jgi:hypothetical protein